MGHQLNNHQIYSLQNKTSPIIPLFHHSVILGGNDEEAKKNESFEGSFEKKKC
jgi:hypothetical protein